MDFLGVGPLELLVILVLALIFVGPERLPQLARSVGNTIRRLREISSAVTAEWERELNAVSTVEGEDGEQISLRESLMAARTDLQEVVSAPNKILANAGSEIRSTSGETKRALKGAQSDLEHALVSPQKPESKVVPPEAIPQDTQAVDTAVPAEVETTPSEPTPSPESVALPPAAEQEAVSEAGAPDDDGDHVDS